MRFKIHFQYLKMWILLYLGVYLRSLFGATHKITTTSQVATITFNHNGRDQKIYLPYDRKKAMKTRSYTVKLIDVNDNFIDITQFPGIPYSVTPKMLGGIRAEVWDEELIKTIEENEIITL